MGTKFRTIKKNGKKSVVPMGTRITRKERQLTPKQVEDMTGVGIRHPGTLTGLGYHISGTEGAKHAALNRAIGKYGKKGTLRKLGELYRLDYNKPELKTRIVQDIRYVSGGKKND